MKQKKKKKTFPVNLSIPKWEKQNYEILLMIAEKHTIL